MLWRDWLMKSSSTIIKLNSSQIKILSILIHKFEESKTYLNKNKINQRFYCKPTDIYPDYYSDYADLDEVDKLRQDISELVRMNLVTIENEGNDVKKIYAVADNYHEYCELTGITAKKERLSDFERIIDDFIECSPTINKLCIDQKTRIEKGKEIKIAESAFDFLRILKCIKYIESNRVEIMERELSIELFSDSKIFEKKYKNQICSLLIEYGDYDSIILDESEKKRQYDMVLSSNGIVQNPTYIYFKGDGILIFEDNTKVELSHNHPVAIISKDVDNIKHLTISAGDILTVENLTSYNRINSPNKFVMYLSGYNNKAKSTFLKKLNRFNEGKRWYHFGDIDPDGFCILNNLRKSTGIYFIPYKMDSERIRKYSEYTKPLEQNDKIKAKSLLQYDEFENVIQYMLLHNCKLEQEIISWKESQ